MLARKRVAEAGLDRVGSRSGCRTTAPSSDGPFDAISSVGMAEHVGRAKLTGYFAILRGLLRPGGRLLNHAIAWAEEATTWKTTLHRPLRLPGRRTGRRRRHGPRADAGDLEVLDVESLRSTTH